TGNAPPNSSESQPPPPLTAVAKDPMVTTLLMFFGQAEAAMKYYVEVFENSEIVEISRYGAGELGKEGTVKAATFSLNGQPLMCIDSPVKHDFTFTPATSIHVSSEDEGKITRYFELLSKNGVTFMPLDKYEFSKRFAWVQDQFGVSWQLSAR